MPPLFDKNQQLEVSELVDSLAKKAPRSHKSMLISQDFNSETKDMETFVGNCDEQKPRTKLPGRSLMSQTRTATPRERKITPSSKNGTKMVKNFIRIILSFIALSMVSTKSTQPGSADY